MQLQLQKPDLERFIDEQVRAGNFPTPEAVIEVALTIMMNDQIELTEEDLAEIELSRQEFDRGETVEFDEFAARMRRKFGIS